MSPRWHAEYAEYVEARLPWLRRIAYLLCQDWHGADDLVQVTATRLFTHWPRAARMDNVDAYVRTILVRTFLDERRSTWFRRVRLPGSLPDRAAVVADQDAVLDVREALAALPPRQRATLVLRYYCDLDVEQAAIALGWLPPGFRIGVQGGTMSRSEPDQLLLFAEPGPNAAPVMLTMYPAGKCRLVGTALPCSPYNTEWVVLSRAPDVNGRAAYWLKGGVGLAWRYAPDGWSELDWGNAGQSWPPRGAERTEILRVAASVRYRQTTPLMFLYWLAGPPKGWRLSDVSFNELTRGPSGVTLTLTDAAPGLPLDSVEVAKADTIQIEVVPADSADGGCGPNAGAGNVTLDGARAELSADGKFLCAANVHGLTVAVILTVHGTIRNPAGPDGALGYARKLHLLGSDPAAWTSNPLR